MIPQLKKQSVHSAISRWNVKLNNISLGLGFCQQYNTETEFNWGISGNGEPDITEFKGNVFLYSAVAAYTFNELFKINSKLNLGLNITYNKVEFLTEESKQFN